MRERFLKGLDVDFDYGAVDKNEGYDDRRTEERELEEEWFDCEEALNDEDGRNGEQGELHGQTGIQDY